MNTESLKTIKKVEVDDKIDVKILVTLLTNLSDDPRSQFYLKDLKSINKKHVRRSLQTSRYELDRVTYSILPKKGIPLAFPTDTPHDITLVRAQNQHTRIDNTQQTTTDKGQKCQCDLADVNYLNPKNNESKFVLVIVDVYSQRVYLYGLYKKSDTHA